MRCSILSQPHPEILKLYGWFDLLICISISNLYFIFKMLEIINMILGMLFILIPLFIFVMVFGIPILLSFIKIIKEYERGVLLAFGKFAGIREPGLNLIIPVYHKLIKIDMRILTVDIPKQEVMTKDNVPVNINAVIYFKVKDPAKAYLNIEDYTYAVSKYGQTSLRNVAGEATLDELLSERQKIADKLREIVDIATDPWGVDITKIELQDIELPENMKRVMAKQAEAERERRAVITKSEGEVKAADDIVNAAKTLYSTPGALQLRTLHTINDLSSDKSNTNIYVTPIEILRFFEKINDILDKINEDDIKKIKRLIKEKSINNHSGI